jgi:hypothetical protein
LPTAWLIGKPLRREATPEAIRNMNKQKIIERPSDGDGLMTPSTLEEPAPGEDAPLAELAARFATLADQWHRDIAVVSSVHEMVEHPAYQGIIRMGPAVVPLILRELQREPDYWFWALTAITGENPVPPEDAGDLDRMTDAWLAHGRARGYL